MINEGWKPRLQDVSLFMSAGADVRVQLMRLDEIDPVISGNKWFKLKRTVLYAKRFSLPTVVTFGGAFSNHLIATAAAAHQYGLKAHGIVRTEPENASNPTLSACKALGMSLYFVSRDSYRRKTAPHFAEEIIPGLQVHYLIPEGGADLAGREGAAEIAAFLPAGATHVAVSVGTGTTLAGLCNAADGLRYLGYCATSRCYEQEAAIRDWIQREAASIQLFPDEQFGGFGKWNDALLHFIRDFYGSTGIPLDVVYTAKMMYRLREQIDAGLVPAGSNIVCIHTGGLQGNPAGLFGA